MLSYQHIYHAGNRADIHKHLWLISVLAEMRNKTKSMTWIDTHAGRGLYDLQSAESQKIGEYKNGIVKLLTHPKLNAATSTSLKTYTDLISQFNKKNALRYYPGSALIMAKMLRPQDRLFAYDLHKGEFPYLKKALAKYSWASAMQKDGLAELLTHVPPKTVYGGVLIDPSYEIKSDYETVAEHVGNALKSWSQAVYMVWYPILKAGLHEKLITRCKMFAPDCVVDEWVWHTSPEAKGMLGSGMIVINGPKKVLEIVNDLSFYKVSLN